MPRGVYERDKKMAQRVLDATARVPEWNIPREPQRVVPAPLAPQWEVTRIAFASKIVETVGIYEPPAGWEPFAVDQGWLFLRRMKGQ